MKNYNNNNNYNELESYNRVKLTGRIVHIYKISENPARVILTLATMGENPKVFATDKIADFAIRKCKVGDYISVCANIQSSFKDKTGLTTTLFCDHITKHRTKQIEQNRFFIFGEIMSVKTFSNDISRIVVKTQITVGHKERFSTVPITFYNPDQRLFAIADNPYLSISGKIQTTKRITKNNETFYYQNYVADFPRQE